MTRLIKDGGDANAVGDKGTSILQWAMLRQSPRGFEALLAAGADAGHADDDGDTVMHYAAKANDPRYLQILLDHHVDPNVVNALSGRTPLMDALMSDRDVQFDNLIAARAEVNRGDRAGDTVLHLAAQTNKFAQASALLRAGADPAARNAAGFTFQRYLFMTSTNIMSGDAISARDALTAWLDEHDIPHDSGQPHTPN